VTKKLPHIKIKLGDGFLVRDSVGIIIAGLEKLGIDTSSLNIRVVSPGERGYAAARDNATHSLLNTGTRTNSNTPAHWQQGDSQGHFLWDPNTGTNSEGRHIFQSRTRFVTITPKE